MKLGVFSTASDLTGPRFLDAFSVCLASSPEGRKCIFQRKSSQAALAPCHGSKIHQVRNLFCMTYLSGEKVLTLSEAWLTSRFAGPAFTPCTTSLPDGVHLLWRHQMCENANLISNLCNLVLPRKFCCLVKKS